MISKSYRRPLIGAYLFGAVGIPALYVAYGIVPAITGILYAQPIVIVTNPFIDFQSNVGLGLVLTLILMVGTASLICGLCCTGLTFGGLLVRDWWRKSSEADE